MRARRLGAAHAPVIPPRRGDGYDSDGAFRRAAVYAAQSMKINIPNQITLGRLVLAIVFFGLLSFYTPEDASRHWILPVSFWVVLIAVLTDFVDGWLARTWHQVTSFGRIVDPVVDKVVICGAFVFFASDIFYDPDPEIATNITGVQPWMAIVILVRELLVSALRSFSESEGVSFAANWVGKIKMVVQSTTVCVVVGALAWYPDSEACDLIRVLCIWLTVIFTALSIIVYVNRARDFILSDEALGGVSSSPKSNEQADDGGSEGAST